MHRCVASARCFDKIVFAFPRSDANYQAFSAELQDAELISMIGEQVTLDAGTVKFDLLASLHCDTMAAAIASVDIGAVDVCTVEGAKQAAKAWLEALVNECVASLDGSKDLQDKIATLLDISSGNQTLSKDEAQLRQEFTEAAQEFVKNHIAEVRRDQRRKGGA